MLVHLFLGTWNGLPAGGTAGGAAVDNEGSQIQVPVYHSSPAGNAYQ
jgi:hypothetical protein